MLRNVQSAQPGSLLKVRLKHESQGGWTYTLIVLAADGRYHTVVVDAQTNRILQAK